MAKDIRVLIVDDINTNRVILGSILEELYEIDEAENGQQALDLLADPAKRPDLILLDVIMPVMDGFATLRQLQAMPETAKIPVIFITSEEQEEEGLAAGAVDFIRKPFDPGIVLLRVKTHIELSQYREGLEHLVEEKTAELVHTNIAFLETMADIIEYRSFESGQHVKRTKDLSAVLIKRLLQDGPYAAQLAQQDCAALINAVPLHDIGKIAIPDSILLKPGKLTAEEFEVMKTHAAVGGGVIVALKERGVKDKLLDYSYDICTHHHERWDGSGYPQKLAGSNIPLAARVVALVDVYDALISERVYKKPFTHEEAGKIILESSGSHFDPDIVAAYIDVENEFREYECNPTPVIAR